MGYRSIVVMKSHRTDANRAVQDALDAARAEQAIAQAVHGFSPEAVRSALARLLVTLPDTTEKPAIRPQEPPAAPALPVPANGHRAPRVARAGHGDKTETLVAALRERPRAPIGDYAEIVYGNRTREAQKKVRSLLAALKRADPPRADNPESGKWEAVEP